MTESRNATTASGPARTRSARATTSANDRTTGHRERAEPPRAHRIECVEGREIAKVVADEARGMRVDRVDESHQRSALIGARRSQFEHQPAWLEPQAVRGRECPTTPA